MMIEHLDDRLQLVPLDLPREGFHHFISTWVYSTDETVILIDPGPSSTIHVLLEALDRLKIRHIDFILITHIHVDHAGGLGSLLKHYPDAKVICHPKGIPHLLEVEKLWAASRKVLGDIAELYGEPEPIPGDCMDFRNRFEHRDTTVMVYETPGHASHHLAFGIGDFLFVGEALGVFYQMPGNSYLRISSPLGFRIREYKRSLALLRELTAPVLCFSHYGLIRDVEAMFATAYAQVETWTAAIRQHQTLDDPMFEQNVLETLVSSDRALSTLRQLPDDIRARELQLLGNSFRGFRADLLKGE